MGLIHGPIPGAVHGMTPGTIQIGNGREGIGREEEGKARKSRLPLCGVKSFIQLELRSRLEANE